MNKKILLQIINGIIPIAGGIYGYLLATNKIKIKPENKERHEEWLKKFGKMMRILCPLIIIFGIIRIIGFI